MRRDRSSWAWTALLGGLLLFTLLTRLPTLGQPLQEAHGFRQTQTAFIVREFHEHGISLAHPRTPVLGRSGEIPFELPLFEAIATVPANLGLSIDAAVRLTGLLSFCVATVLLCLLARELFGARAAAVAGVWFVLSPFSILWSRAALIEYFVVACSLASALLLIRFLPSGSALTLAGGTVAGCAAMLTKPTTAVFWFLPVVAYAVVSRRGATGDLRRRYLAVGGAGALALVLTALWTVHADSVKAADPATAWLTSRRLQDWNFGTWSQRLTLANWQRISDHTATLLPALPAVLFVVAGVVVALASRRRAMALTVLAICVLPPLVFFNLYVVHDYYLVALTAQVCMVLGLGVDVVLDRCRTRAHVLAVVTAAVVLVAAGAVTTADRWQVAYDGDVAAPRLASVVRHYSDPSETVIIEGLDWDPSVPYYADRAAEMLAMGGRSMPAARMRHLQRGDFHTLVTTVGITPRVSEILRTRSWVAAVHEGVLHFGDAGAPPEDAPLVASDVLPAGADRSEWRDLGHLPRHAVVQLGRFEVPARRYVAVRGRGTLRIRPFAPTR
jgi:hypothetical protein